jgi:hypothetical protein
MSHPETGKPEIDRMLARLFEHDSGEGHRLNPLADDLRQAIVEAGPAMTEPLITIVTDEWLPLGRVLVLRPDNCPVGLRQTRRRACTGPTRSAA